MLYNYPEIFVIMLLLPVLFNILLPLAMLVVWLARQAVTGKLWRSDRSEALERNRVLQTA